MIRIFASLSVAITLLAANCGTANAGVIAVAGQVVNDGQLVSQDLSKDALVSDTVNVAHLFTEQTSFQAAVDLQLDITSSGFVNVPSGASPGIVAAGTPFHSYFLHYDIFEDGVGTASGSITFDNPIIGLQVFDRTLDKAHAIVGQAGVTYQTSSTLDGTLDSSGQDWVVISADRKSLDYRMAVLPQVDTIRIFTQVPEPGSMVLLGLGLAGVAGARLRRRRAA